MNSALKAALIQEDIDAEAVQRITSHLKKWQVAVDPDTEYFLRRHAEKLMRTLALDPSDLKLMARIQKFIKDTLPGAVERTRKLQLEDTKKCEA